MSAGRDRKRTEFFGVLVTRDQRHNIQGSIESVPGGWLGVFLKPATMEGDTDLHCTLQIGDQQQPVLLGPFMAVGDDVAVCFRTNRPIAPATDAC